MADEEREAVLKISADVEQAVAGFTRLGESQQQIIKIAEELRQKFGATSGVAEEFMKGVAEGMSRTSDAFKELKPAVEGAHSILSMMPDSLKKLAGALETVRVVLGALKFGFKLVKEAVDIITWPIDKAWEAAEAFGKFALQLDTVTKQLGVSSDLFQTIQVRLREAGLGADAASYSLRILTRNIEQAREGAGQGALLFQRLKVNALDPVTGSARKADDVIRDLVGALQAVPDAGTRAAVALQVAGRGGTTLLALGSISAKVTEEMKSLGLVVGEDFLKQGRAFDDSSTRIKLMTESLQRVFQFFMTEAVEPLAKVLAEDLQVALLWFIDNKQPVADAFDFIGKHIAGALPSAEGIALSLATIKDTVTSAKTVVAEFQVSAAQANYDTLRQMKGASDLQIGIAKANLEQAQKELEVAKLEHFWNVIGVADVNTRSEASQKAAAAMDSHVEAYKRNLEYRSRLTLAEQKQAEAARKIIAQSVIDQDVAEITITRGKEVGIIRRAQLTEQELNAEESAAVRERQQAAGALGASSEELAAIRGEFAAKRIALAHTTTAALEKLGHEEGIALTNVEIEKGQKQLEAQVAVAKEAIKQQRDLNQITELEALTATQSLNDRLLNIERDALQKKIDLIQGYGYIEQAERAKLNAQIADIENKRSVQSAQNATAQLETVRKYQINLTGVLTQSIDDAFSGVILHTAKWNQLLDSFEASLVKSFVSGFVKILFEKSHFDAAFALNMQEDIPASAARGASMVGRTFSSVFDLLAGGSGRGSDINVDASAGTASWVNGFAVPSAAIAANVPVAGLGIAGPPSGEAAIQAGLIAGPAAPFFNASGGAGTAVAGGGGLLGVLTGAIAPALIGYGAIQATHGNFLGSAAAFGGVGTLATGVPGLFGAGALGTSGIASALGIGTSTLGLAGGALGAAALFAQLGVELSGPGKTTFTPGTAKTGIGAGAGALAGTALFPGWGTLIGALVGAIIGALGTAGKSIEDQFGKSLDSLYIKAGLIRAPVIPFGKQFQDTVYNRPLQDLINKSSGAPEVQKVIQGSSAPEVLRTSMGLLGTLVEGGNATLGGYFGNTFTNNARALNETLEQTNADAQKLFKTIGLDLNGAIDRATQLFQTGQITLQTYHDTVAAAVQVLGDLPPGFDAATIAMQTFDTNGVESAKLLKQAMDEVQQSVNDVTAAFKAAATAAIPDSATTVALAKAAAQRQQEDKNARQQFSITQGEQEANLDYIDRQITKAHSLGDEVSAAQLEMQRQSVQASISTGQTAETQRQAAFAKAEAEAIAAIDPQSVFLKTLRDNLKTSVMDALVNGIVNAAAIQGPIQALINKITTYIADQQSGKLTPEQLAGEKAGIVTYAQGIGATISSIMQTLRPLLSGIMDIQTGIDVGLAPPNVQQLLHGNAGFDLNMLTPGLAGTGPGTDNGTIVGADGTIYDNFGNVTGKGPAPRSKRSSFFTGAGINSSFPFALPPGVLSAPPQAFGGVGSLRYGGKGNPQANLPAGAFWSKSHESVLAEHYGVSPGMINFLANSPLANKQFPLINLGGAPFDPGAAFPEGGMPPTDFGLQGNPAFMDPSQQIDYSWLLNNPVMDPFFNYLPTITPGADFGFDIFKKANRSTLTRSGGGSAQIINVNMTLTGNYILDTNSARRLGSIVADAMQARLKQNVRFG